MCRVSGTQCGRGRAVREEAVEMVHAELAGHVQVAVCHYFESNEMLLK